MLKLQEITDPQSCLNRAKDDEFVFVLREKDPCMAMTIRNWIEARVLAGLNKRSDEKIKTAEALVIHLETNRANRTA